MSAALRARAALRTRAEHWIDAMDAETHGRFMDDQILGDFDWRDWFEDKPAPGFLRFAFDHGRRREEAS